MFRNPRRSGLNGQGLFLVLCSLWQHNALAVSAQVRAEGAVVGEFQTDAPPSRNHIQGFRVPLGLSLEARASNTVSIFGDLRFNFYNFPTSARPLGNTQATVEERNRAPATGSREKDEGMEVTHPFTSGNYYGDKGQKVDPVSSTFAYLQWASEVGLFRAGRIPRHWGLGIWRNAERLPEGGSVSTTDALGVTMDFTPTFSGSFYWEKYSEGLLSARHDDADGFSVEAVVSDDPSDVSSHGINRQVGLSFLNYEHKQSSTRLLVMDLFTKLYYGDFGAEGEILFPSGKTESPSYADLGGDNKVCGNVSNKNGLFVTCNNQKIEAFATLWKFRYQLGGAAQVASGQSLSLIATETARQRQLPTSLRSESHSLGFWYGYARGDEDAFTNVKTKDDKVRGTPMHANIRPSLLMYNPLNEDVGGMPGSRVMNTMFLRWDYTYESPSFGSITPAVVWGLLDAKNSKDVTNTSFGRESNLGIELDVAYNYLTTDNVKLGLETGVWSPGAAWDGPQSTTTVFGLRATASTQF